MNVEAILKLNDKAENFVPHDEMQVSIMFAQAKKVLHPASRKGLISKKRRRTAPCVRMTTLYNWINDWKKKTKPMTDIGSCTNHNSQSRDNVSPSSKPVTSTRALMDMALVKQTVENILSKGIQGLTLRKLRRKCEGMMQLPEKALNPYKKYIKSIFMAYIDSNPHLKVK